MSLPSRQALREALASPSDHLSPQARARLAWIVDYVERGGTVTETCTRFGIARGTFHRWLDRFDVHDLSSLEDRPADHAPRVMTVSPDIIAHIRAYRQREPLLGKQQISARLRREHGLHVSGSTVGRVIERECFYYADTPLHWRKRRVAADRCHGAAQCAAVTARSAGVCSCAWCRFRAHVWPVLRWHLLISSVLLHTGLIVLFAWTVLWERAQNERAESLPASVTSFSTVVPADVR